MKNKILFYCPYINGHKLEYIHHLNEGAAKDTDKSYVFVVPSKFKEASKLYTWSISSNIEYDYIDEGNSKCKLFNSKGIRNAWYLNKSLAAYIKKHNVNWVFLIDIIPYLPFLLFQKTKLAGIIYHIYPYTWTQSNIWRRLLDYTRQFLLTRARNVKRIFVLNDELGAYYFNRKFKVIKYNYIVDPIPNIGLIDYNYDLRKEYDIPKDRIVILHPGGMMRYKGTLNILKAITKMPDESKNRFCFVFAGRVHEQIRDEFFELFNCIRESLDIVLIEGYLSAERLNALFYQTDYVLIPYEPRSQSSGIIGLSALFNKPVITTGEGVVGRLVKRYRLGKLLSDNVPETIMICLNGIKGQEGIDGRKYVESHKIGYFQRTVFNVFE